MPTLYQQRENTILIALGGVLVLIILIGLFMNHQSQQKIQQISAANQSNNSGSSSAAAQQGNSNTETGYNDSNAASSGYPANSSSQPAQGIQQVINAKQQNGTYPPDVMDRNIKHMNAYNRQLVTYNNQQSDLITEFHIQDQKAYGQDLLALRDTLDKMVDVYERLDHLSTPECYRKEKHEWMRRIEERINKLNVSDGGPIVSFNPVPTPDVVAYDCFASMPPPK